MGWAEEAAREVIRVSFGPDDRPRRDIDALLGEWRKLARRGARARVTIYLDYQATTPLAPEAAAAMRPWLEEKFANPHSPHKLGREAAAAVEVAREQVLGGARRRQGGKLYFTSGATEAANWALKGQRAPARGSSPSRPNMPACSTRSNGWRAQGREVDILPVGRDGLVDLDLVAARGRPTAPAWSRRCWSTTRSA